MTLAVHSEGSGPPLVLLHGWGLNSRVWDSVAPRLARDFRIVRIDLPGHGASAWLPGFHDAASLAAAVRAEIPSGATVLGWSLGGIAALELALNRSVKLERLVLVSTTPRFVQSDDWAHGLPQPAVERFASLLETDYQATVREFLGLQVKGDEHARATLRELRKQLEAGGQPTLEALRAGLAILRTVDLRERLAKIAVPTLVIAGEYDRMTPPGAARALASGIHGARLEVLAKAGHAPFLSHADAFSRAVLGFLTRPSVAAAS